MAGLHLRTWFHALPRPAHPGAASVWKPPHAKERVPVPAQPGHRTRSPKDGLPRVLKAAPAGRWAL